MLFQESIWCGSILLKLTEINQNLSKLDFKTNEYIDFFFELSNVLVTE